MITDAKIELIENYEGEICFLEGLVGEWGRPDNCSCFTMLLQGIRGRDSVECPTTKSSLLVSSYDSRMCWSNYWGEGSIFNYKLYSVGSHDEDCCQRYHI